MNLYLSTIQNKNSILGADRYSPGDELEVEFIAGEISDIQDEAEILNTPPKIEGKELQLAKDDIHDRLHEMHARSRRVKCPMKRRAIQTRIKNLKKHGSLNQQTSPAMQVWWSGLVDCGCDGNVIPSIPTKGSTNWDPRDRSGRSGCTDD